MQFLNSQADHNFTVCALEVVSCTLVSLSNWKLNFSIVFSSCPLAGPASLAELRAKNLQTAGGDMGDGVTFGVHNDNNAIAGLFGATISDGTHEENRHTNSKIHALSDSFDEEFAIMQEKTKHVQVYFFLFFFFCVQYSYCTLLY